MPCTERYLLAQEQLNKKLGRGAPRRGFKTEGKRWRKVQSSSSASRLSLYKSLRCTERRGLPLIRTGTATWGTCCSPWENPTWDW